MHVRVSQFAMASAQWRTTTRTRDSRAWEAALFYYADSNCNHVSFREIRLPSPTSGELEALAQQLSESPDYRVLRRLQPLTVNATMDAQSDVRRALLIDVETTGLSYATDSIIELGMILFAYNINTGRVVQTLAAESWLQDPGRPIPEEVSKLTGITNEDVRGESINEERVRELATDVKLIIAHNAAFDRPFIDRRLPFLADTHWGCSMNDVPWQERGMSSRKLEILLYAHTSTFLDTHHRALDDCRATLHVLEIAFADGQIPMQLLLANCRMPRVRVAATNSHFDTKDLLRQRGYSWTGDKGRPAKTWCREIAGADLEAELQWMREQIYLTHLGQPTVEKVDLRRRYSSSP